ncbi:MAG: hypothetical protein ACRECU_00715 [Methylocella sp.]
MDIVLGVDTLVFTGILLAKLPPVESARSGRAGTGLSLVLRALLVIGAACAVRLTTPLFAISRQNFPSSSRRRQKLTAMPIQPKPPVPCSQSSVLSRISFIAIQPSRCSRPAFCF